MADYDQVVCADGDRKTGDMKGSAD